MKKGPSSPLIVKYESLLERNPNSLIFAPLAESYRKIGLVDKALKILKRGIALHPEYSVGYFSLALCYRDEGENHLAYSTLQTVVEKNKENIKLQNLFAEICLKLDFKQEALSVYEHVLFVNPKDQKAKEMIKKLKGEANQSAEGKPIFLDKYDRFDLSNLFSRPQHSDSANENHLSEWTKFDLTKKTSMQKQEEFHVSVSSAGKPKKKYEFLLRQFHEAIRRRVQELGY